MGSSPIDYKLNLPAYNCVEVTGLQLFKASAVNNQNT